MDSSFSPRSGPGPGSEPDFSFAFNDINFSDRVLKIEIVPDTPDYKPAGAGGAGSRKRRRDDILRETYVVMDREEQILTCNERDKEGGVTYENLDEEAVIMVEESPSSAGTTTDQLGDEATQGNGSFNMECSTVIRIKTLQISSPILAAKSPFFYKLFSNGMRESEQRHVTLRIQASEEAALMELLNFMYSNMLSTTAPSAVLDVLMAADKFGVSSCMRYCSQLLLNSPMTCESALLYLDLPSGVFMTDAVQPLTNAAKQFLVARFKDITRFQKEVLNLPLAGIEAVFSSDSLQVPSEDAVYDFVLNWARIHYPKLEERREILSTRLANLIRFPHMTCRKLKNILTSDDFDPVYASKVVLASLLFKADPYFQRTVAAEEANTYCVERAYIYRPVKVIAFELPCPQCVVYLDLKKEECANLFPEGQVYSQAFHFVGQEFILIAHCNMDQPSSSHCFGLFLGMLEKGSASLVVDYEFAARSKPKNEFASKYKRNFTFTGRGSVGKRNLFGISWTSFMAEDSIYFINGVLHLRAELTIKQ